GRRRYPPGGPIRRTRAVAFRLGAVLHPGSVARPSAHHRPPHPARTGSAGDRARQCRRRHRRDRRRFHHAVHHALGDRHADRLSPPPRRPGREPAQVTGSSNTSAETAGPQRIPYSASASTRAHGRWSTGPGSTMVTAQPSSAAAPSASELSPIISTSPGAIPIRRQAISKSRGSGFTAPSAYDRTNSVTCSATPARLNTGRISQAILLTTAIGIPAPATAVRAASVSGNGRQASADSSCSYRYSGLPTPDPRSTARYS